MDPITLAIITSLITGVGKIANSSELIASLSELIGKKVVNAKEDFQETPRNLESPTEIQRKQLLESSNELQNKIIFYAIDQSPLSKLLPMLLDQTAKIYEAKTEQD